ncbi:hypothetical protein [Sphingomonas yabuuchiae]|uniref:hypothetical protein n=1 Tax=Sphingomonas yabuuchiae TaxID=172044 RepID=UPI003D96B7DB
MKRAWDFVLCGVPGVMTIAALVMAAVLPGCATPQRDRLADEQAALSIELAYQATAIAALTAMRSDALNAAQKRCVAVLDQQAFRQVKAARDAYDRHDGVFLSQVATAREAITTLLIRRGC